jgi:cytochrome c2
MNQKDSNPEDKKGSNDGKGNRKLTPADIYTPAGTRQDIINEMSRLVRELEENTQSGKQKFGEYMKKKDIQFTKSFEPSTEKDVGADIPIDGDYVNGSRVFMRYCASCHSLEGSNQGTNSVMGPALGLVYGKRAGSDKYFNFSDSYVKSKKVWTEKNLFKYLYDPKKDFPDSKCNIPGGGLKDESDRADLIRFMRLFTKNLKINLEMKAKDTFGKDYIENYNKSQRKLQESAYKNIKGPRNHHEEEI